MDEADIENKILEILAETTMKERSSISHNLHLEADLGLDSISMSSLIAKFETLIIDHSQIAKLLQSLLAAETVGELIELICNNALTGAHT
jgi:acyl carrier protein